MLIACKFAQIIFCLSCHTQISAVPDLCCIVTRRLVESVGRVFDPVVGSAIAVFEQIRCVDWLRTVTGYYNSSTPSRQQAARDKTAAVVAMPRV